MLFHSKWSAYYAVSHSCSGETAVNRTTFLGMSDIAIETGAQPGGGFWGKKIAWQFWHLQKFSKNNNEFYILIIFFKCYWNFPLSCSLIIISLQDRKFRKWLVFNPEPSPESRQQGGFTFMQGGAWHSNLTKIPLIHSVTFCSLGGLAHQILPWRRDWFNHKYAESVNLGDSLNCLYF